MPRVQVVLLYTSKKNRRSEVAEDYGPVPLFETGEPAARRIECNHDADPDHIYYREIVAVVGGESQGWAEERRRVVQHEIHAAVTEPAQQDRCPMDQGDVEHVIKQGHASEYDQWIRIL